MNKPREEKKEIRMRCSKCGKQPAIDKAQSNENWQVIPNKPCIYCGGELEFDFDDFYPKESK